MWQALHHVLMEVCLTASPDPGAIESLQERKTEG